MEPRTQLRDTTLLRRDTDAISDQKTNPNKFEMTEIIQDMFPVHTELEIIKPSL